MFGLFGLLKKNLHDQGKLPVKYYDSIPDSPVTSGCVLYIDAINNNGGSHSNNPSRWVSIIGSNGTKVGSPKWSSDALTTTTLGSDGYRFAKLPNYTEITVEAVVQLQNIGTARFITNIEGGGITLYSGATVPNRYGFQYGASQSNAGKFISASTLDRVYLCGRFSNGIAKAYCSKDNTLLSFEDNEPINTSVAPVAVGFNPSNSGSVQNDGYSTAKFSIYSARIYTRAISDEEMYQNLLYERNRYNF